MRCSFCSNEVTVGPATVLVRVVVLSDGTYKEQLEPMKRMAHNSCVEQYEYRGAVSPQTLSIPFVHE